jgi:hypothetical protein
MLLELVRLRKLLANWVSLRLDWRLVSDDTVPVALANEPCLFRRAVDGITPVWAGCRLRGDDGGGHGRGDCHRSYLGRDANGT